MKILKAIGIVIAVLFTTFILWNASLKKDYNVSRSVIIKSSSHDISAAVSDFKTWPSWSVWFERDSTMTPLFGEITSGTGATYSWTSETQGSGHMEILTYEPGVSMTTEIAFEGQGSSNGYWIFKDLGDEQCEVTWGFKGEMPFMMRWMASSMEQWVGPDFEQGLNNLKGIMESIQVELESNSAEVNAVSDAVRKAISND
jgi:hypothetical protein